MIKVSIIGSGNVAQHLIKAFVNAEFNDGKIELIEAYARNVSALTDLLAFDKITNDLSLLKPADLYIIAVSDHAIQDVSKELPFKNKLVVHTSGTTEIDVLNDNNRKGVFYPLQTFSKTKSVDFSTIPICLESQNASDLHTLETVAKAISSATYILNSEQRKALHVAAVFVNNFTNHLYQLGSEICAENQVPFKILKPLILETANKILTLSPEEAQTGPANRNDSDTISAHLSFLKDDNKKNIYELITQSILVHGKKL
mgnify:FL=1